MEMKNLMPWNQSLSNAAISNNYLQQSALSVHEKYKQPLNILVKKSNSREEAIFANEATTSPMNIKMGSLHDTDTENLDLAASQASPVFTKETIKKPPQKKVSDILNNSNI